MRKNKRRCAGFTIVELILYMGILSMVLFMLTQTFVSIVDLQLESEATSSVEQDSRYILTRLIYDIKRADDIVFPSTLGQSSNTLELLIDGANYSYSLNSGNIEVSDGSEINRFNSPETIISSLSFTRLGNLGGEHTIKIAVVVQSTTLVGGQPDVKSLETTVGLR